MLRRLVFSSLVVGIGAIVVRSLPDVARYMKMRQM
jgi:hypothetical protein